MIKRETRQPCRYDVEATVRPLSAAREAAITLPVRLSNVSASGALAQGLADWPPGTLVRFHLVGVPVQAMIARQGAGGRAGLRFLRPLSRSEIDIVREAGRGGGVVICLEAQRPAR